jgi:tetratricopeptide (TPR) repeat protein
VYIIRCSLIRVIFLFVMLVAEHPLCAVKPLADVYFDLGVVRYEEGAFQKSLHAFCKALEFTPDDYVIHHNIGLCYMNLDNMVDAIKHFEIAIRLRPDHIASYVNCFQQLKKIGRQQEAIDLLRRGIAIKPLDPLLNGTLGVLCEDQGQFEKAAEHFRIVIEQDSGNRVASDGLAYALCMLERYDEALVLYKKNIELDPTLTDPTAINALYMSGIILINQNHTNEAIEILKKVIEHTGDQDQLHSRAHMGIGASCLVRGASDSDWINGWSEYESRWIAYQLPKNQYNNKPFWDGSDLQGKTILVIAEQGFGDTFQFVRYVRLLKRCGARVIFMCRPALQKFLHIARNDIDELVVEGDPLPAFDCQVYLLSLPWMFKTTEKTIPVDIPYLKADPMLIRFWHEKLSSDKKFKVGLCWQGNPNYLREVIPNKSISLDQLLKSLAKIADCSFYSLQKMAGEEQLSALQNLSIHHFGDDFDVEHGRFMDTAALIRNLDLVISVDTSVAHLSAALGVPTWIILPTPSDWRWMLSRSDTPWYPHVRLFRQPSTGDWKGLLTTVVVELEKVVHASGLEAYDKV